VRVGGLDLRVRMPSSPRAARGDHVVVHHLGEVSRAFPTRR
jgi:hypothetical protein